MALLDLRPLDSRRKRALAKTPEGALRDYLSVPLPAPSTRLADLPLLAVDLETTGLDAPTGAILSIGFVPVDGDAITLAGARRIMIRTGAEVGDSATIHGITDDVAEQEGVSLAAGLAELLQALRGRALLAHYAPMETGFLERACREVFGRPLVLTAVDTMQVQYRLLATHASQEPPRSALRLWAARARYGLPVYKAHDALTDALACAELYLALAQEPGVGTTLRDLQR
ncbi:exonuclease domain-containing protein [Propionibacteriaceae bacterium Y1923]|uniref:exonuclease domain-containing protein n=1 Tax=Aestuariimicrobium sp. Y1814 TaxID=3418742 RepID=UPI003C1789CF